MNYKSKQDRQGVRTATDIERKYALGQIDEFGIASKKQQVQINSLSQAFSLFVTAIKEEMGKLSEKIAGASPKKHTHSASDIENGTFEKARLPTIEIEKGGTGATTAEQARENLGVASSVHKHNASDIENGTFEKARLPTIEIEKGGTGATTAEQARENLGVASSVHKHNASDIENGTFEKARLPTIEIEKGGTGATTAEQARENLEITPENIGAQKDLGYTPIQQGGGAGQKTNKVYMGWTGSTFKVQIDETDIGEIPTTWNVKYLSNPNQSYMRLGNLLLQWGNISVNAQANTNIGTTVNFPVQFGNNPTVILTPASGAPNTLFVGITARNTSAFAFNTYCTAYEGTKTISWFAIGSA